MRLKYELAKASVLQEGKFYNGPFLALLVRFIVQYSEQKSERSRE